MAANTLLFTLFSGLVLLGIVALVLRLRTWRRGRVHTGGATTPGTSVNDVLQSPTTWTVGFLLVVLVTVAGTLALVGAVPVPESTQAAIGTVLLVVGALLFAGFVFGGVYASVRGRGYGSAPAVGLGSLAVGLLALLVVVVNLFLG